MKRQALAKGMTSVGAPVAVVAACRTYGLTGAASIAPDDKRQGRADIRPRHSAPRRILGSDVRAASIVVSLRMWPDATVKT
jgi:hypothetical protein